MFHKISFSKRDGFYGIINVCFRKAPRQIF